MSERASPRPTHWNSRGRPELWGGVECSRTRLGDRVIDQLDRSGHAHRSGDLDRFAELGFSALRYPVLWERGAPDPEAAPDWTWSDQRLARLRELGIRPILGLVHHGSGPFHTDLTRRSFVTGLARYARAVAERYPWVTDYTPVNEPLTTARFSGLYGVWYPHGRDRATFSRALVRQCRAIAAAMRAIREVNPAARLVQTEDLGRTHSTPRLAYQARFENRRRWLTWDLLCGRVDRDHPLTDYLLSGVSEAELLTLAQDPCPPDIIGINHYLTSERFLDERLGRYPADSRGGNERHRYADVEAVRVLKRGPAGAGRLLHEAWARYRIPVAVTEVHLGCTRDEQLRWFMEVWDAAHQVRSRGVDVTAVTAWSLLGAYDWDSLVTRDEGRYEPGAFDVRGPAPRATALARVVSDVARGRTPEHPVLGARGWWRRAHRLCYPPVEVTRGRVVRLTPAGRPERVPRAVLLVGAAGPLERAIAAACAHRAIPLIAMDTGGPPINRGTVERMLAECAGWAVLHVPGTWRDDEAEHAPKACRGELVDARGAVAAACARAGAALLAFSTDAVFAGEALEAYTEDCALDASGLAGQFAAEGEAVAAAALPSTLVVRFGPLFGPAGEPEDVIARLLRYLAAGRRVALAGDGPGSPTYVPDLVREALDLLVDGEHGVWHLMTPGTATPAGLAIRAAELAGIDSNLVDSRPAWALGTPGPPTSRVLASRRGELLPPLKSALERHVRELRPPVTGEVKDSVAARA